MTKTTEIIAAIKYIDARMEDRDVDFDLQAFTERYNEFYPELVGRDQVLKESDFPRVETDKFFREGVSTLLHAPSEDELASLSEKTRGRVLGSLKAVRDYFLTFLNLDDASDWLKNVSAGEY